MVDRIVTTNFSLLRWMNGTHEKLVEKLGGTSNWKKMSDYVMGHEVPGPRTQASVEKKLGLPAGWTSRDNISLLHLTESDYDLVTAILKLDTKTKVGLLAFAKAVPSEV